MVKTLSNLGQALLQTSYKPELLSKKPHVLIGKRVPLVGKMIIAASSRLVFCFLQATKNNRSFVLKFETIQGSFGLFIH